MQSERDTRDGVSRSHGLLDSFQGFGSRRSMFPSLFGGRDPIGDPFFSRPIGSIFESSMFGPSSYSSDTPESGRANKISVEELNSDDEGGEDKVTGDERDNIGKQSVSGKEPSIEHPDDVVDAERKSNDVTYRNDRNNVEGAQSQGRNFSVQTCRVTYGGVDGAYYTSTRTRRAGGDGVALEETKEADKTTGQATHRISRGLHDKGHSVTRKLTSDGKVDVLQTLHNLNEDELPGFEIAWNGNVGGHLPGWKHEFDIAPPPARLSFFSLVFVSSLINFSFLLDGILLAFSADSLEQMCLQIMMLISPYQPNIQFTDIIDIHVVSHA